MLVLSSSPVSIPNVRSQHCKPYIHRIEQMAIPATGKPCGARVQLVEVCITDIARGLRLVFGLRIARGAPHAVIVILGLEAVGALGLHAVVVGGVVVNSEYGLAARATIFLGRVLIARVVVRADGHGCR
jgi:hypothetical protein